MEELSSCLTWIKSCECSYCTLLVNAYYYIHSSAQLSYVLKYFEHAVLVLLEELVQGPQRSELHDQHEVLSFTDADHTNDVRVIQLLHDARFPQHLVLHRLVIIIILQDLNSDNLLCPESNIKEDPFWKMNVFKSCRKSYLRAECTWMAPLIGKLNTSAIHEEADKTTKQPNHISHNTWWQERKKYTTLTCLFV